MLAAKNCDWKAWVLAVSGGSEAKPDVERIQDYHLLISREHLFGDHDCCVRFSDAALRKDRGRLSHHFNGKGETSCYPQLVHFSTQSYQNRQCFPGAAFLFASETFRILVPLPSKP